LAAEKNGKFSNTFKFHEVITEFWKNLKEGFGISDYDPAQGFDPASFVEEKLPEIRKFVGNARAAIATSGGVDSTACAALAHCALGKDLVCFFMDTGFMREGEVNEVKRMLMTLGLPLKVLSVKERFLEALSGKADAESKRLAFRQTFYTILGEAVKKEGCEVLIQGTIAPDWIETSGGIKTQHNVLEQLGVDTLSTFGFRLLEPLMDLYKDQVRALARHLGIKESERQPFPGPGLLVRCIGVVTEEKIDLLRRATKIAEDSIIKVYPEPKQYLAAVIEDERRPADDVTVALQKDYHGAKAEYLAGLATGVKGDDRAYGKIVLVSWLKGEPSQLFGVPAKVIHSEKDAVRVLYIIDQKIGRMADNDKKYVVIVRAVETRDFMTAKPSSIPLSVLREIAGKVLGDPLASAVAYDLTSKPPATVEFE
jgi:GMP synthase (glutamine-hydrolysing)